MKKNAIAAIVLVFSVSAAYAEETVVTGSAGGVYPPGTGFLGVPLQGLQAGFGVEIDGGSAFGEFCTILVGVTALGLEQRITVEGKVMAGSLTAPNVATFSGTCRVDMGDGTPPLPDVPFAATVVTNANDQGTLGLVIGQTTLPAANIEEGTIKIK